MTNFSPFRFLPLHFCQLPTADCRLFHFSFRSAAVRGAIVGAACGLICWGLNGTPLMRDLENWLSDSGFAFRGRRPSTANVIIVAMDEASLREIDKPLMFFSPELAKVVTYLHDQGAAAIGVDFLLPAGDTTMEDLRPGRRGDTEVMGQAVSQAGNVVLPEWFLEGEVPQRPPYEWYDQNVPSERPWADLGFVDLSPDADLCLRRQELRLWDDKGNPHAYMALALLAKARGLSRQWMAAPQLSLDGAAIPTDSTGCLRINYVGPAGTIRRVPFRGILAAAGRASATQQKKASAPGAADTPYKDAIVLIGMTVGTFQDRYPTPYSSASFLRSPPAPLQMPGVEIHANVLATLMDRAFITTPWFLATPLMLLFVGGAMGALLARCSLEMGALATIVHHLAWRGLAAGAFCLANWRVEMVAMLVLGVLLYGTIFAMRWRWIRRMMGMVKSEAVARALEAGGAKLDLGGQQREITVLFCDVRDFTPFSERHSPHEVVRLLNAFFAAAVPAIEAEGGAVNLYIGDAVMVLFGAPQSQPDHALRAVRAGVEVVRRVHALADRWKELGAEDFRIGIGIHTGKAVVGTVGSPRRLDYTAIGDTVNTAARIESANKEFKSEILISQATFSALPETEQQRISAQGQSRSLSVKGKRDALQVYSVA
jgi:adenylate cyclase